MSAVFSAAALLLSFGMSLFFGGYRDIIYAPALLALLAAAGLAVFPALRRGLRVPSSASALILLAFWVFATIGLSWSSVPFASLVTWLVLSALPLACFAFLAPVDNRRLLTLAGGGLMAGLAVLAVWAVAQVALQGGRAHGPLNDPNNLATLFVLGLLPALALAFGPVKPRRIMAGVAALLFCGLLATQSRSGLLALALAAAPLFFVLRPPVKSVALTVLPALILVAATALGLSGFGDRLAGLLNPGADGAIAARLAIIKGALALVQSHPWTGTGLGTFYLYYPAVRLPLTDDSTGDWAHFDALQFWAETGVAGFVLFYAAAAATAVRVVRALRVPAPDRALTAGLACALLAAFVQSHTNFTFYVMPILIVCGVWLAALHTLEGDALGDGFTAPDLPGKTRAVVALCVAAVIAMIAVMAASSAAGQHYLLKALDALGQGRTDMFIAALEKSERYAPASFIDPDVQIAAFYSDILKDPGVFFSAEERQKMFADSMSMLAAAETMNPAWAEIDYRRARLFAMAGPDLAPDGPALALDSLRRAVSKNPMHFRARVLLAQGILHAGQADAAYDMLLTGLRYPHPADIDAEYKTLMKQIAPLAAAQKNYRRKETP